MPWPKGKVRDPATIQLMRDARRTNRELRLRGEAPLPPRQSEFVAERGVAERGGTEEAKRKEPTIPLVREAPPQKREDHAVAYALPAVTIRARKAERKVYALLEEFFDGRLGLYRHQYSDARVAEETELSEHAVVVIRKSAFGELRQLDPQFARDLAKLQRDAEDLGTMLAELRTEIKRLEGKLLSLS
jgi:hypothetical protein